MAEVVHVETRFDRVGEAHGVHRVFDGTLGQPQRPRVGLGDPLREPQSEFAKLLQRHHWLTIPARNASWALTESMLDEAQRPVHAQPSEAQRRARGERACPTETRSKAQQAKEYSRR
jgi:hypothetical protein